MKLIIAVIVMLAAMASAEYQVKTHEDLVKYRTECVEKCGTSEADLEKYKKADFPDNAATHSYMNCILEKFGFYDSEKGFNVEDIHAQVVGGHDHADHSDDTHAKIQKCATEANNAVDASTRAYTAFLCMMREHLQLVKKSEHGHEHDHSKH